MLILGNRDPSRCLGATVMQAAACGRSTFSRDAIGDDELRQVVCHHERRGGHEFCRLFTPHGALAICVDVGEGLEVELAAHDPCGLNERSIGSQRGGAASRTHVHVCAAR